MADMTTIIGRVGRDVEVSTTPTGKKLAKYSVAVNGYDSVKREPTTRWYEVSAFEGDAEIAESNVTKGARVYVTGVASVYHGTSGDKDQIKVREQGAVERFVAEEEIPF